MIRALAAIAILSMTGCYMTTQCGNATVKRVHVPPLGSNNRTLLLPRFNISEVGRHSFDVIELPVGFLPQYVYIPISETDLRGTYSGVDPPFVGAQLAVQYKDSSGAAFYSTSLKFDTPRGFDHRNDKDFATYRLPELPEQRSRQSYQVLIDVITPSSRAGDVAELRGYRTELPGSGGKSSVD